MPHHLHLVPTPPPALSFDVRFARGDGARKLFGLYGKGTVRITKDTVTISGKRHRMFRTGAPATHTIEQRDIFDVEMVGATVRFDVWGGTRTTPLRMGFTTDSDETADTLAAALSRRQTHEFIQEHADHDAFANQLDTVSKRVLVTPTILGLNVLIFVLMALAGAGLFTTHPQVAVRWGSNAGQRTLMGEWWRLLTSTFIHFGLLHLVFNMVALAQAGPIVERLYGSVRFLALYVFAAVFGELTSLYFHPTANGAGASGAIFGVFGALLVFVLNPRNAVPAIVKKSIGKRVVPVVLLNLAVGMLFLNIDNAAHVGGLIGGALIGVLLARPLPKH